MSEVINVREGGTSFRWQLLATASAIALIGSAYASDVARAADDDADRPAVWIELGGQLSRLNDAQEAFSPSFPVSRPPIFLPAEKIEKPPAYSIDESAKASFQPSASDWVFSASVLFGRSSSNRDVQQQTNPHPFTKYLPSGFGGLEKLVKDPIAAKFAETAARNTESHFILDFQAGKDVGLGMFGGKGSSVLSLGVRFAQFSAKSNIALKSDPDWHFSYKYTANYKLSNGEVYHSNAASLRAERNFHGIGPSVSWNASVPFAGNAKDGELTADWGVNAAILFGRQRAQVQHQTTAQYKPTGRYSPRYLLHTPLSTHHTRSRAVTAPNVGGFAGLSFVYSNAKISAGYRADLFFGPMDGGIDTAKKENVGFYGPFASVSVGIGG